ncbi:MULTISPECIES: hypothetical protein [unclassified Robiginitalea]|uniref:hypothetical protein n=1 Tax=Robiginitalea TaxID=252306 RepID=UPI00234BFDC8|nr:MULTISPECIES: hypothetical protein [unclassified Robiginitalea]MDC6355563.1 hypothetical protein [Robiginitalea sp. PM2]MDC6375974.1 hypothetical protein [Robiginitalea sp. SP8]
MIPAREAFALVECADESILKINPLIREKGLQFKGYDYKDFVDTKLEMLIDGSLYQAISQYHPNNYWTFDGKRYKIHPGIIQIIEWLGVKFNPNPNSLRGKIYFLESTDPKSIDLINAESRFKFELTCIRLQKVLSIFLSFPLRFNLITASSEGARYKHGHSEKSSYSYPDIEIFPNQNISGIILTEDEHFKNLVNAIFRFPNILFKIKTGRYYESRYEGLDLTLTDHPYIDLAIVSYAHANDLSLDNPNYELNLKTKLTLLITSLESLFNVGPIQIAHTVSRHYAVMLWNPATFQDNYKFMKFCYELRSTFIHGNSNASIEEIDKKISRKQRKWGEPPLTFRLLIHRLNSDVKDIIQLVLLENKNKEDLFHALNSRGVDPNKNYEGAKYGPKPY